MNQDRRTSQTPNAPARRYEDVKASAASAADRIERAGQAAIAALRAFNDEREEAARRQLRTAIGA